jgi:flagellar motor switch protein FliN
MAEKEPESAPQEAAAAANDPVGTPATPEASATAPGPSAAETVAATAAASTEPPVDAIGAAMETSADELNDQAAIDELLRQASLVSADMGGGSGGARAAQGPAFDANVSPLDLPSFSSGGMTGAGSNIDLLRDVDLNVKIELGRSRMLVEDVLKLSEGSVVELDKPAGDPVDIFVNDRLVARGEVLVLNDNFCVRVNEIVAVAREESA